MELLGLKSKNSKNRLNFKKSAFRIGQLTKKKKAIFALHRIAIFSKWQRHLGGGLMYIFYKWNVSDCSFNTVLLPFLSSCVQFWVRGIIHNYRRRDDDAVLIASWSSFSLSWSWTRSQPNWIEKWKWIFKKKDHHPKEELLQTTRMLKDSEKPLCVVWQKINWIIAVLISGLPFGSLLSLSSLCSSCAVFMD